MSSDDEQGWVPATCLEAQDDPDDFSMPADEGKQKTSLLSCIHYQFRQGPGQVSNGVM